MTFDCCFKNNRICVSQIFSFSSTNVSPTLTYLVAPSPNRNVTSGLPPGTLPRPPVPSISALAMHMMMMMMMHMIVMTAARIVRSRNMAAILSLFHAPILFLRAPGNLLLLRLLHLNRLLHSFALSVVLVWTSGARWFSSRPMTMTRRRANVDVISVQFCAAFNARWACKEVEGEGFPSSATLFFGPAA